MESRSPIKEAILRRVKVLYILFLLLGVAIIARALWLQFGVDGDTLRGRSVQYSYRNDRLEAIRGQILSDDGRILATSMPYYELRMDMDADGLTSEIFAANVDSLGIALAAYFKDKSAAVYSKELKQAHSEKKRYYLITPNKVDHLELQTVKRFPLFRLGANRGGFMAVDGTIRRYPHGELAKRTIGFVNQSGVKLGIEGGFDDQLRGTDGLTVKQKISGNFWVPVSSPLNIDPIDGIDVITTLNIELQDILQSALNQRIMETEADWGCAIVMEVATGQVKALANITRTPAGELVEDYNYAIGTSMEPGSTFKLATLIALLEDAKMPLSEGIDTEGGRVQIGPVRVVDSHLGYGVLTLQEAFEKSSNVGMAKAVDRYYRGNPTKFVDAINKLGIYKPLDIQIGGEARPMIKHPSMKGSWDGTTMTMMSYGYALRLAPIHTLALYNAIANGGVMVKPQFVSELRQMGRAVETYSVDTLNRAICSPQTLSNVRRAMEGVVLRGTGRMLLNDKYSVAAKTGTAQIAIGRSGYKTATGGRHYLGSMAGYMPADKPKYTIIVAMKTHYEPGSGKVYYGTALAGPLFRDVCERLYTLNYNFQEAMIPRGQTYTPSLKAVSGSSDKLKSLLGILGVRGAPVMPVAEHVALDSGLAVQHAPVTMTAGVPDLMGMTLDEALTLAEQMGLRPIFKGIGTVRNQSIEAGTPFEQGTTITITLSNI